MKEEVKQESLSFMWDEETPQPIEESSKEHEEETDTIDKEDSKPTKESSDKVKSKDSGGKEEVEEEGSEDSGKTSNGGDEEEEVDNIYLDFFNDLKDKGIFRNVELPEDEELTADKLFELQEQEIESEVTNRLNVFGDRLGDDGKHFLQYIQAGGKASNYFDVIKEYSLDLEGDLDDEAYQDKIIRYKMSKDGRDEEEIEERLEYLSEKGKKKQVAERSLNVISKDIEEEKKEIIESVKREKEELRERKRNYREALKLSIAEINEIKGIKVSQNEKEDIVDFLTRDAYTSNDGQTITEFQKRLYDVFNDTDKSILLAKMLMTDFDLSDFAKSIETKSIKKVRSNLENRLGLVKKDKSKGLSFDWSKK